MKKDLGVLNHKFLGVTSKCAKVAMTAKQVLAMIYRTIRRKRKERMVQLYNPWKKE